MRTLLRHVSEYLPLSAQVVWTTIPFLSPISDTQHHQSPHRTGADTRRERATHHVPTPAKRDPKSQTESREGEPSNRSSVSLLPTRTRCITPQQQSLTSGPPNPEGRPASPPPCATAPPSPGPAAASSSTAPPTAPTCPVAPTRRPRLPR